MILVNLGKCWEIVVLDFVFLAIFSNNFGDRWIMDMTNSRKEVVLNLAIESSTENVPH